MARADTTHYLELGESWYRSLNGYALTPGHASKAGERYRTLDPSAAILRCFGCHSTGPVILSPDEAILPAEHGVRCEVCHGPGSDHAANPATVHLRNPAILPAHQVNELCGQCHRMPAPAGAPVDLKNPWNARHQPLMLAASSCFRKSAATPRELTCFTCHQPHENVNRTPLAYNNTCVSCHTTPKHQRPVTGLACVTCHMPDVKPSPTLRFANHRIGIYTR